MKKGLCLLLTLALVILSGCTARPPETLMRTEDSDQRLITADTMDLEPDNTRAAVYFRYGATAYLAPEERLIATRPDETPEKTLAQALVEGPLSSSPHLAALFPPGTQVLSAQSEGDTLFVTLNGHVLDRFPGEKEGALSGEGRLRRQLSLDALAATLIEAGLCTRVQVMVERNNGGLSSAMRLQTGYLTGETDETILPPLTWREEALLTPYNTVSALLENWQAQQWDALYDFIAREENTARPEKQDALADFLRADALTGFGLSHGSVSTDGKRAVVRVELTLRDQSGDRQKTAYPVLLTRENGLWKISYDTLLALMGAVPDTAQ